MKIRTLYAWATALVAALSLGAQTPTPTTITYQGRLTAGDKPANGLYDLDFRLFDAVTAGTKVASALANGTSVSNGVFTASLDLVAANVQIPILDAAPRWIEIRMRPSAQPAAPYSILSPRQPVTSAPKAVYAYSAGNAATATTAITASNLSGNVVDAQVPASIARLGANQTFAGNDVFTGILSASNVGNTFAGNFTGKFSGNGAGLNALDAGAISTGNLADARLSANVALLGSAQVFSADNLFKSRVGIGLAPTDGVLAVGGDMHLSDSGLFLRAGANRANGLLWAGGSKPFGTLAPNGPVLFGTGGGVLGVQGNVPQSILTWNNLGRVGINSTNPTTALEVDDYDATLRLKNWNDAVGAFVGDSYSALQLGLYNPTEKPVLAIPANSSRTFFAMSADGRVGSTTSGFIADPQYRNYLDDGNGNFAPSGIIRTANTGTPLEFRLAVGGSTFSPALRLSPVADATGPNVNIVAGSPDNAIAATALGSSVLGGGTTGNGNTVGASAATIAGGLGNTIDVGSDGGFIGAGTKNHVVNGAQYAFIGSGFQNLVDKQGSYGMVPGGVGNVANGGAAFAAGYNARANHDGAFVWSDSVAVNKLHPPFLSQAPNEFAVRATGGVRFVDSLVYDQQSNTYVQFGVFLGPGSSTWSQGSDRNAKTNFASIQPREVLAKIAAMPVSRWRYKTEPDSIRHVGPMAQDFHAAFGLGHGETTIDSIDADGIALAAIQGLNQKVEDQAAEIRELKALLGKLALQVESQSRHTAATTSGQP